MIKKINFIFSMFCILTLSWNCTATHSFSGASISPEVKTVSVDFFPSSASLAPPSASQLFTESLKDIFQSQTNLSLVQSDGDLEFSGSISNYRTSPVAIQGNETAALTRVSMTVKVKFVNNVDDKQSFESTFTRFEDFETTQDLSAVEEDLLQSINNQLSQDIFNKAVTNW